MPAPADFAVGEPGQRVGDGVDVGGDRQAQMLLIIAGVDDDQELFGWPDPRQAKGELGAADAAGKGDDH